MSNNYIIHACPERMWYVKEFLVPSLLGQGIERERIEICEDKTRRGNLAACMESFRSCTGDGGAWHLQDDVIICRDFAERTAEHDSGIVCGYCFKEFGPDISVMGLVPAPFMWNSFPCIRIPHELARECAEWFYTSARYRPNYAAWVRSGKHDDGFWHDFICEVHPELWVLNLKPALVDHVDFLLGGSTINRSRLEPTCRAEYWTDEELVEALAKEVGVRNAIYHNGRR